jgi:serine/threonine protein kinase
VTFHKTTKIEVGTKLGRDLTVLGIVDDRGAEPVFLVWHHRSWCPMLCKIMSSEEAALREAGFLQAVEHPNIVRCFGVHESTCLLMEYLEGPSLHRLAKSRSKRRLAINDTLRISVYVGSALNHVHERGLLHLDVKPANIIVAGGRPVLCDFGIARRQGAPRPKTVTGTEDYIAPEECRMEDDITTAADVFGLGVTLYELLGGRCPFPEKKTDADPYPQTLLEPLPLRQYRPAIPLALERLILQCLNAAPASRPALCDLMPGLHKFIKSGTTMWPHGFDPLT